MGYKLSFDVLKGMIFVYVSHVPSRMFLDEGLPFLGIGNFRIPSQSFRVVFIIPSKKISAEFFFDGIHDT